MIHGLTCLVHPHNQIHKHSTCAYKNPQSAHWHQVWFACVQTKLVTQHVVRKRRDGNLCNHSIGNWTLLLGQSVCIATSSDSLPCSYCVYSVLHLGICYMWHGGHHPSHSGMLLFFLSGQSRWPQVIIITVIDDLKGDKINVYILSSQMLTMLLHREDVDDCQWLNSYSCG